MIPGLDGLRAIAILLVFVLHADYIYVGWVGVQLFFVLSGFLITTILLRMKETERARDYFKKFYGRRFLRIFPLYYFYLALMFAITTILIYSGYRTNYMKLFQEQVPYALVYGYNIYNASSAYSGESRLIGHLWSLSTEEQFYIFWPLILFLTPQKNLKKLLLSTILAGLAFRLGITALFKYTEASFFYSKLGVVIYVLPFSQVDAFALGAMITQFNFPKARQQFFFLLALLPVIGLATQFYSTGGLDTISALGFPFPLTKDLKQVWGYLYLDYLFALLVYLVVKEKMFLRLLESRIMLYLGKISYGLYVYHYAILWFVARIRDLGIQESIAKPLTLLISAAITFLLATISYKYIEKPILDMKDRYFPSRISIDQKKQPDAQALVYNELIKDL
jgi:peptidoglycan/LPS O-acetylase OafA/YrhL